MTLYTRLFVSHLLAIAVALGAVLLVSEAVLPSFVRHHVQQMVTLLGPSGETLRPDLERGARHTLNAALLASVPAALLASAVTALVSARRVVRSVELLRDGSRAIATGEYSRRLPEDGRDELADLARHFNRMAAALAEVERSRVELLSNVAHELRTPLAALRGYAEALSDHVMTPAAASAAIVRETRAVERLARDLSLVSRVEAGAVELRLTTFPAASLLNGAAERFTAAFEERGLVFRVAADGQLPVITSDFERSAQVLANLLGNALRYTPAGGRVTLHARSGPDDVLFTVADTGPGIPPEQLERIFERFYRVDPARSRTEGSGVGLTIARGLAGRLGGHLHVTSGPGGSSFTFRLPAVYPA